MSRFIPVEPEKWGEMVKAQAEVVKLRALVDRMNDTINVSQAECRRLKAEVERLTKAGDIVFDYMESYAEEQGLDHKWESIREVWINAAKEGGQP